MSDSHSPGVWQPLSNTQVIAANTTSGTTSVTIPTVGISGYFQMYNDSQNIIVANFSAYSNVTVLTPNATASSDSVIIPPGSNVGWTTVYPFNPYNSGQDDIGVGGQSVWHQVNVYVAMATVSGTGNVYIQNGGWM